MYSYPFNGLGNVLYSLGRYREAAEAYRQAIALDPGYAYPHSGLGYTLHSLSQYEEAIAAYQTFITLADKKTDGPEIEQAKQAVADIEEQLVQQKKG